jgi:hypothetical protein
MAQSFINRPDLPLGLRNNNVGNLRPLRVGIWEGQIGTNGGFVVFQDVGWGIRAFATNFYTSINKHKTDTLRKYISRYAPESENDTLRYINYVSSKTGINPDQQIPRDAESLKKILRAQIEMENGKKFADMITDQDIETGISRLSSPVASFFNATKIYIENFTQENNKTIRYGLIGGILLGVSIYSYFIYKKRLIK